MDCGRGRVAVFVLCVQRIDLVWDCVCFDCVFDLERTVESKKYTVCLCARVAPAEARFAFLCSPFEFCLIFEFNLTL